APDLMPRIASYRAGYLPAERRAIEARLSRGDLLGVISTSALEHGIDIGGLDACVLIGYPGSIMSSWQRIGRVGRSDRESLVVLVALPDALDQYFMANPAQFFERSFEKAAVDPENPIIASQHLVCAGAEVPLTSADAQTYSGGTFRLVDALCRSGGLVADASGEAWYSLRRNPQRDVNLRAIGAGYSIEDADSGRAVGTVGGARAFVECHEGAIYLHQGQQFEVIEMDRERRRIVARRAERDYYTQVLSDKETEILEVLASRDASGYRVGMGRLRVTQRFREYVRRRISDQQKISAHPLDLPPVVYETVGLWWEIPDPVREESARRGDHFMGSIHASEHAAISLFPLLTICDRNDIGGISYPAHPQLGGPAVFIYDGYPGGIGLAAKGYSQIEVLVQRTLALVASCPCQLGCPSCIHSPKCGSGNHPLDKAGARFVLESLARPREPGQRPARPAAARPSAATPPTAIPAAAPPGSGIPAAAKRAAGGAVAARAPGTKRSQAVAADKSATSAPAAGRLLFLDVETQRSAEEVGGWDRIDRMGLALAVVFDESDGAFRTYFEADVDRLIIDLLSADRVVGFNIKRFDYTVLRGYRDAAFHRIPTCDMLEVIHQRLGFRLKLGHLAETTLGEGKSADGLQSLRWYREGRLDLIEEYCRKDVDVTRRLYHFGRERGYLLYRDREQRSVRVPVEW
ncbi:MAG TPA: Zn-binding domain-containing protein, partial [Candidatus Polarisedimenticolia bacterium]|nr:Zn-binding domain-containing protein [Candidatus Polarisedimenticolia bacterium]